MSNCEASANDVQKLISEEIRVSIANMVIEVTDAAVKEEYFAGREPQETDQSREMSEQASGKESEQSVSWLKQANNKLKEQAEAQSKQIRAKDCTIQFLLDKTKEYELKIEQMDANMTKIEEAMEKINCQTKKQNWGELPRLSGNSRPFGLIANRPSVLGANYKSSSFRVNSSLTQMKDSSFAPRMQWTQGIPGLNRSSLGINSSNQYPMARPYDKPRASRPYVDMQNFKRERIMSTSTVDDVLRIQTCYSTFKN